jgi:hypothetical protein
MLKPGSNAKIAFIQRWTDQRVRLAAIDIAKLGGQNAVGGYLNNSLCNLIGVAIAEQGKDEACGLMVRGFQTAEAYTERAEC